MVTMFELNSILRYYPIDAVDGVHYTALFLEEGVLQIKGGARMMFPTVEDWLQSLPGSPDPSMIQVSTKLAEQQKHTEKRKNVQKDKKKWNVPALRNIARSLPWARHIYTMIRECDKALLQREDMRDAFNHLVHILLEHNEIIQSSAPYKFQRYTHGISVVNDNVVCYSNNNIRGYVQYLPHVTREQYVESLNAIYTAYQPLYVLLHDTVVPFMEQKYRELCKKRDLKIYQRARDKYVKQMMRLNVRYEKESAYLRGLMERYQSFIDQIEQQ